MKVANERPVRKVEVVGSNVFEGVGEPVLVGVVRLGRDTELTELYERSKSDVTRFQTRSLLTQKGAM